MRFFYLYPRAPQQSRDVPAVAGFLCDNASVLGAVIKKTKKLYFHAILHFENRKYSNAVSVGFQNHIIYKLIIYKLIMLTQLCN